MRLRAFILEGYGPYLEELAGDCTCDNKVEQKGDNCLRVTLANVGFLFRRRGYLIVIEIAIGWEAESSTKTFLCLFLCLVDSSVIIMRKNDAIRTSQLELERIDESFIDDSKWDYSMHRHHSQSPVVEYPITIETNHIKVMNSITATTEWLNRIMDRNNNPN